MLAKRVAVFAPLANKAAEAIGEYGMAIILGVLGFEPALAGWTT